MTDQHDGPGVGAAPVLGRRRGPRWVKVAYGLHRPRGTGNDLEAWQLVLPPSGRFTHLTAAARHGLWLPPMPEGLPVWAAQSREETRPQRSGLRVSRHPVLAEPVTVDGLRLDPPAEALLACARDLSVLDMVVLVDSALHLRLCTRQDVAAAAALRRRGAPRLRTALELADARAESPYETLLRRLHEACGIAVEPQYRLEDESGALVARGDLWLCGTTVIHEYDGEHHLQRRRQRKDLARARRIGNRTWLRRGYTREDLLHQAVGILRDADLSLGREHRPERIREWHRLLADSLFTPSGQARLLHRLGVGKADSGSVLDDPAASGGW